MGKSNGIYIFKITDHLNKNYQMKKNKNKILFMFERTQIKQNIS